MCVLMTGGGAQACDGAWVELRGNCVSFLAIYPARDKVSCYSPLDLPGQLAHRLPVSVSQSSTRGTTKVCNNIWLYMASGDKTLVLKLMQQAFFPLRHSPCPRCWDLCKNIFLCSRYSLIFMMNTRIHTFVCK